MRYFFHVLHGSSTIKDDEGTALSGPEISTSPCLNVSLRMTAKPFQLMI